MVQVTINSVTRDLYMEYDVIVISVKLNNNHLEFFLKV